MARPFVRISEPFRRDEEAELLYATEGVDVEAYTSRVRPSGFVLVMRSSAGVVASFHRPTATGKSVVQLEEDIADTCWTLAKMVM